MKTQDDVLFAFRPFTQLSPVQSMKVMKIQKCMEDAALEMHDLMDQAPGSESVMSHLLLAKFLATQCVTHDVVRGKKSESASQTAAPQGAPPVTPKSAAGKPLGQEGGTKDGEKN